jgi:hypothetical protein
MTTKTDLEDYYKNLLIIQYHDKPKARATIAQWVDCMTGDGIMTQLWDAFDVDTAIGAQLDAIGKLVGIGRFDLPDDKYRVLIKFKILKNNIGTTMKDIDDAIFEYFGNSILVNNNKDMSITYILSDELGSLIPILTSEDLLPAPLGVGVSAITSVDPSKAYFGYKRGDMQTDAVGFSTTDNKQEAVWISASDIS